MQISNGFRDPKVDQMPCLRQILKGVKEEAGKAGKAERSRLPITLSILQKMKTVWFSKDSDDYNRTMRWAASVTTFFSFCQSGEITVPREDMYDSSAHLSYCDIAVNDAKAPAIISLQLKQSKTDQRRVGTRVIIGKTGDDMCPVSALLTYLVKRGSKQGPLFQWCDGSP